MAEDKEYTVKIPDFRTRPSAQVGPAVNQLVDTYRAVAANLIGQLRDGDLSNAGKVHAVYLLGEWRAVGAVSTLLTQIDLKAEVADPAGGIGRWGMYPAQEALSKIGMPAVNMILDLLPGEKNELRRKLMSFVISDVVGKDFGKVLVGQRREKEADPTRRANLEFALKVLDSL